MLPEYILLHHTPPPPRPATLTVNAKGRVYPSQALLSQLKLRAGQPVNLLPPDTACANWQLDLRPTATRRIAWHENTRPRIDGVCLPAGLMQPDTRLTLALASTTPTATGLYQLTAAPATALD